MLTNFPPQLHTNDLTGPIPVELCALSQLTNLNLYTSHLTGPIPRCLGNLSQLTDLELGLNDLTGTIPVELCRSTGWARASTTCPTRGRCRPASRRTHPLTALVAPASGLTGALPQAWHLPNLGQLILSDNQITGALPST